MSHTNTTTHYNLPVFVSSDKPAWLVDFNGAMEDIDEVLYDNAEAITGKENALTFSSSDNVVLTRTLDTVSADLSSDVKTRLSKTLVTPANSPASTVLAGVNTSNIQTNIAVGRGLQIDNGTLRSVYDFNLVRTGTGILTIGSDSPQIQGVQVYEGSTLRYALNSDRSIGKIYGRVTIILPQNAITGPYMIDTGITVKATGEQYTISNVDLGLVSWPGSLPYTELKFIMRSAPAIIVTANGNVRVRLNVNQQVMNPTGSTNVHAYLSPNIYFFEDFGDTE